MIVEREGKIQIYCANQAKILGTVYIFCNTDIQCCNYILYTDQKNLIFCYCTMLLTSYLYFSLLFTKFCILSLLRFISCCLASICNMQVPLFVGLVLQNIIQTTMEYSWQNERAWFECCGIYSIWGSLFYAVLLIFQYLSKWMG